MKKGFTLIEVLAVIVILAILSTLLVPTLIGIINDSKQKSYEMQILTIKSAARDYITENGITIASLETVGGTHTVTLQELITLGYIEEEILNPLTNSNFDVLTTTVLITKTTSVKYTYQVNHS